ncbi:hypothetical protein F5B22DRAFT_605304 [Xylaria bambusicola]|uniref:uncharacterized protein n=1 Tax=Xylaria bambusicola TaxID=326684 RepID=UPI0020088AC6|nr:uncharacterized protein F5B22DRAFT_605304 [Xylaria bambusicola]KAI0517204.1 hypothetical protein F5B22DRAFT_605304 [Xylaria bambusicola]
MREHPAASAHRNPTISLFSIVKSFQCQVWKVHVKFSLSVSNGTGIGLMNLSIEKNNDRRQSERRDRVLGDVPSHTNKVIVLRRWQFDSHDRDSVIQGLFSTRVSQLSSLVAAARGVELRKYERGHSLSRRMRNHVDSFSQVET